MPTVKVQFLTTEVIREKPYLLTLSLKYCIFFFFVATNQDRAPKGRTDTLQESHKLACILLYNYDLHNLSLIS